MKKTLALLTLVSALAFTFTSASFADGHDHVSNDVAVFFEIPVVNFDRAVAFYETIMAVKLEVMRKPEFSMAFFPVEEGGVTGALATLDGVKPSKEGPVIYLNGGENLQVILDRVVPAGGQIVIPKTLISPEVGYFAYFLDTEGNRLGLFSAK